MLTFNLRLRSWPTLAAVAGIAAGIALGNWQLGRAHEKEALAERVQTASRDAVVAMPGEPIRSQDIAWRQVTARGRFEPKYMVLIDNRVSRGVAGYNVIMPIEIGGSDLYVLVNRGWIAGTGSRTDLPEVKTPAGEVEVRGLAIVPPSRIFELSSEVTQGRVWQNLVLERYGQAMRIPIQPVVIRQENDLDDGLRREWNAPDVGIDRHYGYAFQWFALALTIFFFYLYTHVRKKDGR